MGIRLSKTLKVKIAYYMQNLGTIFTFTFRKTFTIAEHWALTQMAASSVLGIPLAALSIYLAASLVFR
jgi:hypothetical protein